MPFRLLARANSVAGTHLGAGFTCLSKAGGHATVLEHG